MINELINGPKLEGAAAVACSDLLGLFVATLLSLLKQIERAKSSTQAKNLSATCRNLVISMAICVDKATSLDDLAGVVMVKPDRKLARAARHYLHLLASIPTSRRDKVIRRDRVTSASIKRDNHARISNSNVKNVVKHIRPNVQSSGTAAERDVEIKVCRTIS